MADDGKYYDHDAEWRRRAERDQGVWGSQSGRMYDLVLGHVTRHVSPGVLVIDAGCGAGDFGRRVVAAGLRYIGIEDSGEAVALAKRRNPDLEVHQRDLALPLPAEPSFPKADAVTAINVLHCLVEDEHRRAFLTNLRSLCRAGGIIVLTTMAAPALPGLRPSARPRRFVEPETIEAEILAAGFSEILARQLEEPSERCPVANLTLVGRA